MSLNDYETSTDRGQPVELYLFQYGDNEGRIVAYTNAEQEIEYDGNTYTPIAIERDNVATEGRGEGQELSVKLPLNCELSELFRVFPPGRVVTLTIRQGHLPNPDDPVEFTEGDMWPVVWVGAVLESRRSGNTTTLNCENSQSGMKRVGLRLHFQWSCGLALYSARCGADKQAARTTATATVDGNEVTLSAGWNGDNDAESYIGGLIEWDSDNGREYRAIMTIVSENVVTTNATLHDFVDGGAVDVFLGCPHNLRGCRDIHDNAVNYGGQHLIPLVNPVNKNNHT